MVAAEHNILENVTPRTWRPVARPIYSDYTVAVHAGDLVMSSSRSSIAMQHDPIQRSSSVAALSSDATERSTMTATEDAYRLNSFGSMATGYRLTPGVDGRCLVVNTAAGSSAALASVLTTSISRFPRISISRCGNAERSSPARDTASSDTTSSQAKFLVRLSSRLAVLTASPSAVIAARRCHSPSPRRWSARNECRYRYAAADRARPAAKR